MIWGESSLFTNFLTWFFANQRIAVMWSVFSHSEHGEDMLLMLSWCTTLKAVKVLPSKYTTLLKTPLPGRFTLTYRIVVFFFCCAPNRWVIGLILPPCIFRIGISDYVVVSRYTCRVSSCALVFKITVYISYFDGFFLQPKIVSHSFHFTYKL